MYSVLSFKATRGFQLIKSGLEKDISRTLADEAYHYAKLYNDQKLLASGVSIMITTDEDALILMQEWYPIPFWDKILYQCGSC